MLGFLNTPFLTLLYAYYKSMIFFCCSNFATQADTLLLWSKCELASDLWQKLDLIWMLEKLNVVQ